MSTSQQPRVTGLETRSIDYVPLAERHGKLWHLGPLWFMSNAQIATLAVGLTSITAGGNLIWSLIAIVTGTLLGTFFMAFHSAQGPQLGLPQMIQSRPQFGYVGALLVWLFAYVQYAGFNVFNSILAGQAMHSTAHGGVKWWVAAITVLAFVIALVGYDVIHRAEQLLTYTFLAVFGVFTVGVLCTLHYPAGSFDLGGFKWTPFLAQFGVVAGYQISWAIYVSDYSRYLPPNVTVRKTFYWTYFGSALGGAWLMILGALLAAWAGPKDFDTISAINAAGDKVFSGFGAIVLVFAALGLVSVTALNMYGGSLTLISAADSFRKIRPTVSVRVVTIGLTAALSLIGALAATSHFLENFNNFLLLVLYLFIPWTAVNLMDYYVVRRGHYAIAEIFNPHGMYGRWGWRGIISYLVGFGAMVPFFAVGTLYTGPAAHALDGADISLFIGLPVSGLLYWWLARTIDLDAEIALAAAEAKEVEPSL
jgi:NCS1 nucleoside transporter family